MTSMTIKAAAFLCAVATTASAGIAGEITVKDAFALSSGKMTQAGAAFVTLENQTGSDDRLIDVASDAAVRVELHTHKRTSDNVMKMIHVKEGFALPKDGMLHMKRGGNHIMFMGLTEPWEDGDTLSVTLLFEKAGEVEIDIPVDLKKAAEKHSH